MASTAFFLHSSQNRRFYPPHAYPITHILDRQSMRSRRKNQKVIFERYSILFLFTAISFFIMLIVFFPYLTNALSGPYHLSNKEFVDHVEEFRNGRQGLFSRMEYVQVELGENRMNNIYGHQYSTPPGSRLAISNRIATFFRMPELNLFVKLPSHFVRYIHAKLPFDFSQFSVKTLKCVWEVLKTKAKLRSRNMLEKVDYVKNIEEEYSKNTKLFNMHVLTKCGIFVGFLYNPGYRREGIKTSTEEVYFHDETIALDTAQPYITMWSLMLGSLIFLWLSGCCFCFLLYWIHLGWIELKFKFFLFPLIISDYVAQKMQPLNFDGPLHEQSLQLDELIKKSEHQFSKLFIIENAENQLFVVLLPAKLNEMKNYANTALPDTLTEVPFRICPVSDILRITYHGITDAKENRNSLLMWPSNASIIEREEYANWLHDELMENSEDYQNQFQNSIDPDAYLQLNGNEGEDLIRLIEEENNIQRMEDERCSILTTFFSFLLSPEGNPASSLTIAQFRLQEEQNHAFVNEAMQENPCLMCHENFVMDQPIATWPCTFQHQFHKCMLKVLRTNNLCPLCRVPAEFET